MNKRSFVITSIPLLLSLSLAIFTVTLSQFLPPKLPLFYSLSWGERQLASNLSLLIIPAIITLIAFLNLIILSQLHPQQVFFKNILLISSLLVSLILTITFLKIVLIFI